MTEKMKLYPTVANGDNCVRIINYFQPGVHGVLPGVGPSTQLHFRFRVIPYLLHPVGLLRRPRLSIFFYIFTLRYDLPNASNLATHYPLDHRRALVQNCARFSLSRSIIPQCQHQAYSLRLFSEVLIG